MKPVIFDECLFKLIPHVIIVSFALSLHFSPLFLFMNDICHVLSNTRLHGFSREEF